MATEIVYFDPTERVRGPVRLTLPDAVASAFVRSGTAAAANPGDHAALMAGGPIAADDMTLIVLQSGLAGQQLGRIRVPLAVAQAAVSAGVAAAVDLPIAGGGIVVPPTFVPRICLGLTGPYYGGGTDYFNNLTVGDYQNGGGTFDNITALAELYTADGNLMAFAPGFVSAITGIAPPDYTAGVNEVWMATEFSRQDGDFLVASGNPNNGENNGNVLSPGPVVRANGKARREWKWDWTGKGTINPVDAANFYVNFVTLTSLGTGPNEPVLYTGQITGPGGPFVKSGRFNPIALARMESVAPMYRFMDWSNINANQHIVSWGVTMANRQTFVDRLGPAGVIQPTLTIAGLRMTGQAAPHHIGALQLYSMSPPAKVIGAAGNDFGVALAAPAGGGATGFAPSGKTLTITPPAGTTTVAGFVQYVQGLANEDIAKAVINPFSFELTGAFLRAHIATSGGTMRMTVTDMPSGSIAPGHVILPRYNFGVFLVQSQESIAEGASAGGNGVYVVTSPTGHTQWEDGTTIREFTGGPNLTPGAVPRVAFSGGGAGPTVTGVPFELEVQAANEAGGGGAWCPLPIGAWNPADPAGPHDYVKKHARYLAQNLVGSPVVYEVGNELDWNDGGGFKEKLIEAAAVAYAGDFYGCRTAGIIEYKELAALFILRCGQEWEPIVREEFAAVGRAADVEFVLC